MSATDPLWYFGYGSNMSRAIFLEQRGMRPRATRIGRLDGYRLCFNIPIGPGERAVANIEAAPGEEVWGALYLLSPADMERLDNSEGVPAGIYQHLKVDIQLESTGSLLAVTYQSSLVATGRKPSFRYASLLLDGAREHGLPDPYIRRLEALELAVDERPGHPQPS